MEAKKTATKNIKIVNSRMSLNVNSTFHCDDHDFSKPAKTFSGVGRVCVFCFALFFQCLKHHKENPIYLHCIFITVDILKTDEATTH